MRVQEFLTQLRNTLKDHKKAYWDDSELLDYYNECKLHMATERLENKTTATLALDTAKEEYDTSGVIRYISAIDSDGNERKLYPDNGSGDDDSSGIIILDYNKIKVNTPETGVTITLRIVAQPQEDNMDSTVRVGDEQSLKYYILSKAYEADLDTQDLEKSNYFYQKYLSNMKQLTGASSVGYTTDVSNTTEAYFY